MAFAKKISDFVPPLKDQGMDYLAGAAAAGLSIQAGTGATTGGTLDVVFDKEMANAAYIVIAVSTTPMQMSIGVGPKTTTGMTLDDGGGGALPVDWLIVGQLKGQTA